MKFIEVGLVFMFLSPVVAAICLGLVNVSGTKGGMVDYDTGPMIGAFITLGIGIILVIIGIATK